MKERDDFIELLEKRNTCFMNENGLFAKNTKIILDEKQGKPFINKKTGIIAVLSSTGKGKMISNTAVEKSVRNGFTIRQHNECASKIDKLFEYATPFSISKDNKGSIDIKSIKRFISPIIIRKENGGTYDACCFITVKESVEDNKFKHKLYSVEEIKIEQVSLKGAELTNGELIHTPLALTNIIRQEIKIIKKFDKEFNFNEILRTEQNNEEDKGLER